MNAYQKQSFKRALELNTNALNLSKRLREGNFKSKDTMLSTFSETWNLYEELFSILKNLISGTRGELFSFFSGCYESYVNDYKLLKGDMSDLLLKTENTIPLRNKNSAEQKILQDLISDITTFESVSLEMIDSGRPDKIKHFFFALNNRYLNLFKFVKGIFEVSDKQSNFSFSLTPQIQVTW